MNLVTQPATCEADCHCDKHRYDGTKLVVLTGGPGAGKTAVLEIIRKELCEHVVILPEAASVVFGGGFWRLDSVSGRKAAQRAILHIQQETERMAIGEKGWALALCDRGVLDGLAYWPDDTAEFWDIGRTSMAAEYARYHTVIHLRTPTEQQGYNHQNPLRTESAAQARAIDNKIVAVWSRHPRYHVIESTPDFLLKARRALEIIAADMPVCCAAGMVLPHRTIPG